MKAYSEQIQQLQKENADSTAYMKQWARSIHCPQVEKPVNRYSRPVT